MVLTAGKAVRFYGSPDCLHWEYLSEFGHDRGSHVGPWECPDLFPLRVEGSKEIKWVLLASVVNFTETPDIKSRYGDPVFYRRFRRKTFYQRTNRYAVDRLRQG